ncbi:MULTISPECIES: glycosyltransferase [Campylobacter]|uniref:glycosyltransferase n=1 Tax=Campylobacter TaxID=194 RepID=UPI000BB43295|nr:MULTISPECIES: glycosyltransferase [Campylobacter]TWO13066.1 glycosyltransferase [Campylobacter lanienae]
MLTPKISIIIPVYNVEKYISQCLDSAINQSLKDILAKRIAFLDEALYYYRIREGFIMRSSAKSKRVFDIFKTFDLIENFLIEQNLMDELKIDFIG